MLTVSSSQAQSRMGAMLNCAQKETVAITRRGRTVAYMVDQFTYRRSIAPLPPVSAAAKLRELDAVLAPVRQQAKDLGLTQALLDDILNER
jgi:PHD/YefM family antitoxin component YafN of YafNO toxin-antitoxin module